MRRVFLVRHGDASLPDGEKRCIGTTDVPLSDLGRMQGALLSEGFAGASLPVYTSRLRRARDTAAFIGDPIVFDGLEEQFTGEWEGLTFREIREKYPELYEKRARDFTLVPPGAESIRSAGERFVSALERILARSEGDILVVSHATVIQSTVCALLRRPLAEFKTIPVPTGSVTTLLYHDGRFGLDSTGKRPKCRPTEELCLKLHAAVGNPEGIVDHCRAVAEEAVSVANALGECGVSLNINDIIASALLHDIARRERGHARVGAERVAELGWESVAEIVGGHEDMEFTSLNEAAVVYIADKITAGTARVSVRERFEKSAEKCRTPEAMAAHERKLHTALQIQSAVNSLCNKEIIP